MYRFVLEYKSIFFKILKLFVKIYDYYSEVNKMIDQETLKTFDILYYESYNEVLKYVICNCSNIQDIKDIVQNVYLEVIKKIKKESKVKITKQYIMGIAKNKVIDYYRFNYKNKIVSLFSNKEGIELLDQIPSDYDLEDHFIKETDLKIVWEYLKKKKVIISKIFYLYYYEDYEIKEIAKVLNISESNVKNNLYRTLKELKTLLNIGGDKSVY